MTEDVIAGLLRKDVAKDSDFFENTVQISNYLYYQETLLAIYAQILTLKYLFLKGTSTLEQCASKYNQYVDDAKQLAVSRTEYFEDYSPRFKADLTNGSYQHKVFLFIKTKKQMEPDKQRAIEECLNRDIEFQPIHEKGFYEKPTVLLIKDGKYYPEK